MGNLWLLDPFQIGVVKVIRIARLETQVLPKLEGISLTPDIIVQQPSGFLITVRSLLGMLHDEDK